MKIWISRSLIATVVFINLMAAIEFMAQPQVYAPGFELEGEPGAAMIQGMGLLFLMWNVPYLVALLHPAKHFVSLIESVAMQAIGVAGESALLLTLPGSHPQIQSSVTRFILFDGGGLIFLLAALGCVLLERKRSKKTPLIDKRGIFR
jgi:hypothetical protein